MKTKISKTAIIATLLLTSTCLAGQLLVFEDFRSPQTGLFAPIGWFDGKIYTRDGQYLVNSHTFLSFDFARKPDIINRAGGFIIEFDITAISIDNGWAGISIGGETIGVERGEIGLKIYSGAAIGKTDLFFSKGKSQPLPKKFNEGQKVRIEIFTTEVGETKKTAVANIYFDNTKVVSDFNFNWNSGPTYINYYAGGSAHFDNLKVYLADPVIEFTKPRSAAPESNSTAKLTVNLKRPLPDRTYSVDYAAVGGTAGNGDDYNLAAGTLTFPLGTTTKTIAIQIKKDRSKEYDETIKVKLFNPSGGEVKIGENYKHIYTIEDRYPIVTFDTQASSADESAGTVEIPVKLSRAAKETVTINFTATGGSADNKDYKLATLKLKFKPGQTTQNLPVTIIDDKNSENSINETVTIALTKPKNARLGKVTSHTLAIIDNEPGIEFDGAVWIPYLNKLAERGGKKYFFINEIDQLEWTPTYATQMTVKLPEKSLAKVGDVAEYSWLYMSQGPTGGSGMRNLQERWGSGDFRWGIFDSNGKPIDEFYRYSRSNKIFGNYTGYHFRSSPHERSDMTGGKWGKRKPGGGELLNDWYKKIRYMGNSHPIGEFTPLIIRAERTAKDTVVFSVTQNNFTQTLTDNDPTDQPKKIDSMAINFPNDREFKKVIIAKIK